jgi:hypothetical protein
MRPEPRPKEHRDHPDGGGPGRADPPNRAEHALAALAALLLALGAVVVRERPTAGCGPRRAEPMLDAAAP